MKIVFMGTPDFALPSLKALIEHYDVCCVYTQAPKEAGRGQKICKSAVQCLAEEHGIEVRTPKTFKDKTVQDEFLALKPDICVVAAYGMLLPKEVLHSFPIINVHASLLPRWRGAAPIARAIEAGDKESGVTIMQVVEKLDAGDMYAKESVAIDENTTAEILHDKLAAIGADLLIEVIENWQDIRPLPQDELQVTYAKKLDKCECCIDANCSADDLVCKIMAFSPYPGMYLERNGERFKILQAKAVKCNNENGICLKCADGFVEVLTIQRQGKKPMSVAEFLKGYKF